MSTQHPTIKIIAKGHVASAAEMRAAFDVALAFVEDHPVPDDLIGGRITVRDGDALIRVGWHDEGFGPMIVADTRIRRDVGVL